MPKLIRVLHVVTKMDRAGYETVLMNVYRHIDRTAIAFDFLTHRLEDGEYDDEIRTLGGNVYYLPPISLRSGMHYLRSLEDFFRTHHAYDIVQVHLDALSGFALMAAKRAGIRSRIVHSHNNGFDMDWKLPIRILAKRMIPSAATHFWGCSQDANRFMFGKRLLAQTMVIPNGIDCTAFAFSQEIREQVRRELGLEKAFIVGHVGRLSYQKNHAFLLKVFHEIAAKRSDAHLILAGKGELEDEIRSQASSLGLNERIHLLGSRPDVNRLMQAMDVFVFPSHFEGFGNVLIEAQAAGLPVFASGEHIPRHVAVTETMSFLSLKETPSKWAEQVLNYSKADRCEGYQRVAAAGYDIMGVALMLQGTYSNLVGIESAAEI